MLINNDDIDLNKQEPAFGETALYIASKHGINLIVAKLINQDTVDVNRSTKNRTTPLIVASANGHSDIVEMLLAHPDIEPNYVTFKGQSSLFHLDSSIIFPILVAKFNHCVRHSELNQVMTRIYLVFLVFVAPT